MQKYYLVMNDGAPLHVCLTEEAAKIQIERLKERDSAKEEYKEDALVDKHMDLLCNFHYVPVDGDVLSSCFGKLIPADEPSFTLRASDSVAPDVIGYWVVNNIDRIGTYHPNIISAREIMRRMLDWPNRKLPD